MSTNTYSSGRPVRLTADCRATNDRHGFSGILFLSVSLSLCLALAKVVFTTDDLSLPLSHSPSLSLLLALPHSLSLPHNLSISLCLHNQDGIYGGCQLVMSTNDRQWFSLFLSLLLSRALSRTLALLFSRSLTLSLPCSLALSLSRSLALSLSRSLALCFVSINDRWVLSHTLSLTHKPS